MYKFLLGWKLNMFPLVFHKCWQCSKLHVQLTVRTGSWYNSIISITIVLWRAENLRCSMYEGAV